MPSSKNMQRAAPRVLAPEQQPRLALPAEPVLSPEVFSLDFIADAFQRPPQWQADAVLTQAGELPAGEPPGLAPAAVLLPLLSDMGAGVRMLLTRRAAHLTSHAGQISFPGGRIEAYDHDAVAAALRETQEEIGVEPAYVRMLGTQPRYQTASRFLVTPVVGALQPGYVLRPDAAEVADVFEVPLADLMDPRRHQLHEAVLPDGSRRRYYAMPWGPYFIWGVTAALLRNFYHYLAAAQAASRKPGG